MAIARLAGCDGVVVALSGGVDSAVLLALAVEALGPDRVLAATGVSDSLPAIDLEDSRRVARHLGVRHRTVVTREMERESYRVNDGSRCFHCRDELFDRLREVALQEKLPAIAYGAITDDLGDHRPGMRAATDHGVLAPLLEAGIGTSEVRELAREAGLPVDAKPAAACLSSRIPVGTEVTTERLAQVERAESVLRGAGFGQFRVRHHGSVARLELDPEGLRMLADPRLRSRVTRGIREAGFLYVTVDLEGYRSGSLDVVGSRGDRQRTGPKRDGGQ